MSVRSFFGGLIFAASAAGLLPAVVFAFGPRVGVGDTLAVYLVACTAAYVAWIAPTRRQAILGGLGALLAGSFLVTLLPDVGRQSLAMLSLACALIISVCRSAIFYTGRPARALVLECGLTLAGLLLARLLSADGVLSVAAALWSYLLVQSLFALAPGRRLRRVRAERGDPFDRASARLRRLLDEVAA